MQFRDPESFQTGSSSILHLHSRTAFFSSTHRIVIEMTQQWPPAQRLRTQLPKHHAHPPEFHVRSFEYTPALHSSTSCTGYTSMCGPETFSPLRPRCNQLHTVQSTELPARIPTNPPTTSNSSADSECQPPIFRHQPTGIAWCHGTRIMLQHG
jgi:hypothetical protein